MGLARLEETCAALVAGGRRLDTPAAVVSRASLPGSRLVVGTLADVSSRAREAAVDAPALLIVGEVVARRVESATSSEAVARAVRR
jgi:siroheme synthase